MTCEELHENALIAWAHACEYCCLEFGADVRGSALQDYMFLAADNEKAAAELWRFCSMVRTPHHAHRRHHTPCATHAVDAARRAVTSATMITTCCMKHSKRSTRYRNGAQRRSPRCCRHHRASTCATWARRPPLPPTQPNVPERGRQLPRPARLGRDSGCSGFTMPCLLRPRTRLGLPIQLVEPPGLAIESAVHVQDPPAAFRAAHAHADFAERVVVVRELDKYLTCGRDGTLRVWHAADLALARTLHCGQRWITDAAFLKRERRLCVASMDRSLTWFDCNRGAV